MAIEWKIQQARGLRNLRSKSEGGLEFILSIEKSVISYGSHSCPIFLFLDPVSSLKHAALQSEGAIPLQFVSWWYIFMQKSALCLLAAIPPIPTWLWMQEPTIHIAALWEESAHLLCSSSC